MFKRIQRLNLRSKIPASTTVLMVLIVTLGFFTSGCNLTPKAEPKKELQLDFLTVISLQERSALEYLLHQQSDSQYGIYTNYKETTGEQSLSSGHEQLSESIGLMMEYALNRKSKPLFDTQFQLLKEKFLTQKTLAKWRVHNSKNRTSDSSALVDDLRIMKSLYQAGELWGDQVYTQLGDQMNNSILLYETQDADLLELYDGYQKSAAETVPLFYLDLAAMNVGSAKDTRWQPILDKSRTILAQGVISEKLPLYHHTYNYSTRSYSTGETVNMIEALLPLLNLYELGETNPSALHWLNQELNTHQAIFASYHTADATPASQVQSTAVYALTARIAHLAGDDALSTKSLSLLSKRQIEKNKSPLSGAFGDEPSKMVYSYDNLQALLAYSQP